MDNVYSQNELERNSIVELPDGFAEKLGDTLYSWLGSIWRSLNKGDLMVRGLQKSRGISLAQMYLDIIEAARLQDRNGAPVFHRELWHPIVIRRSARNTAQENMLSIGMDAEIGPQPSGSDYGDGTILKMGKLAEYEKYVTYPIEVGVAGMASSIVDNIINPEVSLKHDVDFVFRNNTIIFPKDKDPLSMDSPFEKYDIPGSTDDPEDMDTECVLWASDVLIDKNYISEHLSYVLGANAPSSDIVKRIINAAWSSVTSGLTPELVKTLMAAMLNIPVIQHERETVLNINIEKDGNGTPLYRLVTTDKGEYRVSLKANLRKDVSMGAVLNRGDLLDESLRVYPFLNGISWKHEHVDPEGRVARDVTYTDWVFDDLDELGLEVVSGPVLVGGRWVVNLFYRTYETPLPPLYSMDEGEPDDLTIRFMVGLGVPAVDTVIVARRTSDADKIRIIPHNEPGSSIYDKSYSPEPVGAASGANAKYLFFRPNAIGISNGDELKYLTFVKMGGTDYNTVYARVWRFSGNAGSPEGELLSVSDGVEWVGNGQKVTFTLNDGIVIDMANPSDYLVVDFSANEWDHAPIQFRMGCYNYGISHRNPDFYWGVSYIVPVAEVGYTVAHEEPEEPYIKYKDTGFSVPLEQDIPSVVLPSDILRVKTEYGVYAMWGKSVVRSADGNPEHLMFDIGGTKDDVNAFWKGIWSRAAKSGKRLSSVLHEGDIIPPAAFFLRHLVGANTLFVVVDDSQLDDPSLMRNPMFFGMLLGVVPSAIRLFLVEHRPVGDDKANLDEALEETRLFAALPVVAEDVACDALPWSVNAKPSVWDRVRMRFVRPSPAKVRGKKEEE